MSIFAWHRLPRIFGLLRLNTFRNRMREQNLSDTDRLPSILRDPLPPPTPRQSSAPSSGGAYHVLGNRRRGSAEPRFGRNIPLDRTLVADEASLMYPSPRIVSHELMTRHKFQPATALNLLAAAWIQFQIHDWFSHG